MPASQHGGWIHLRTGHVACVVERVVLGLVFLASIWYSLLVIISQVLHKYIYIYIYIHMCVCVCVCVYTHRYTYIYTQTHTQTHIYIRFSPGRQGAFWEPCSTHTHTHTHTRTHTPIHTNTNQHTTIHTQS